MVVPVRLSTRESHKYPGKQYEQIESDLALDYETQQGRISVALGPYSTCRKGGVSQAQS